MNAAAGTASVICLGWMRRIIFQPLYCWNPTSVIFMRSVRKTWELCWEDYTWSVLIAVWSLIGLENLCVISQQVIINSTITPNMTFTKTSQKFGQWADSRANTVFGLGFASEQQLSKVRGFCSRSFIKLMDGSFPFPLSLILFASLK